MDDNAKLFDQILEEFKQEIENDSSVEELANIKDVIANYKNTLDVLDDCIFVDVLDELSTYNVDLKQFDELLNKEELTESEETYVLYLIDFTNSLIRQHIINKIQELNELLDKF